MLRKDPPIQGFQNEYRWLSNFVWAKIEFEGLTYPSVEHAYVAAKIKDVRKRPLIAMAASSGEVKRMGNVMDTREDWIEVREDFMMEFLIQKFSQPKFRKLLLDTGDAYIEETNAWGDTFWGVCRGEGLNRLGTMIMEIRESLRELE